MTASTARAAAVPALVVLLLALQLVALYAPNAPGPSTSIPYADKIVHALLFSAPVLVAGLGRRSWWILLALGSLVHAPVSEVVQHALLAGRSGDVWDVVADLAGVGLASIAVPLTLRRPRRRRL